MEKQPKRTKLVQLDMETADQLDSIGKKGDTYDQIVRKLVACWVGSKYLKHVEDQND